MLYDLNEALLGQRPEDIQSTTLASFVSRKMLIDIVSGELPPGRELGTMSLKTRYGIKSQSPIRQALWLLSDSGFVVPRGERRGYNVAPLSFEEFEDIVRASCKLEEVGLRASIQQGGEAWENRVLIAE
jgi:DNA-binding GntR family transcriptional regulator